VVAVCSMREGQPQRMTGRRAMTLFVALRLCWMQPTWHHLWRLHQQTTWSGPAGRMERRRTSTGGPPCTVFTRRAAWQAANDGRAAERMHDHVAMSRPPNVQLCCALTVVAGCRRLEDRRKQRCSSQTGCEPEQWRERLASHTAFALVGLQCIYWRC